MRKYILIGLLCLIALPVFGQLHRMSGFDLDSVRIRKRSAFLGLLAVDSVRIGGTTFTTLSSGATWDSLTIKAAFGTKVDTTTYKAGIGAKADTVDLLYLEDSLAAYPDTLDTVKVAREVRGTDCVVSDSISGKYGMFTSSLRSGTGLGAPPAAAKFWEFSNENAIVINGADSSGYGIKKDTLLINNTGNCGYTKVDGRLVTGYADIDTITADYAYLTDSLFVGTNAAGFWKFNAYDAMIAKVADSSGIGIKADTLLINNAGNCANVSVKGNLVASYADIDTVVNTGWLSSPYADIDTVMINGLSFKGFIINGAKDSVWLLLNADTLLIMP